MQLQRNVLNKIKIELGKQILRIFFAVQIVASFN